MTGPGRLADLLIVGGLTIDHFADGSSAPGGAVLHAGRAAAAAGLRTTVVTVAGPEPVARRGLAELTALAELHATDAPATICYRHRETNAGRRLWLEADTIPLELPDDAVRRLPTSSVLFAPVAGEVPAAILYTWDDVWRRGAIIQGWLRNGVVGAEVAPIVPDAISDDIVRALGSLDVLVASREDLGAAADTPVGQLDVLRRRIGRRPVLVVTDGADGVWIDMGHRRPHRVPAPVRVDGVPTVGAGDAFAALFLAHFAGARPTRLGSRVDPRHGRDAAATYAMHAVAEMLEGRRA